MPSWISQKKDLNALLPNTEIFTQDLSLSGFSTSRGFPIEFTLEGPDWDKLLAVQNDVVQRLRATGLVEDINNDTEIGMPEVHVIPDREAAAKLGSEH